MADAAAAGGTGGHGGGGVTAFGGFASFLAHAASSCSASDQVKSDVIFVLMELLQCCLAVAALDYRPCGAGSLQVRFPIFSVHLGHALWPNKRAFFNTCS